MKANYLIILVAYLSISCEKKEASPDSKISDIAIEAFVTRHNLYRAEVGVEGIIWSADVAESAQSWANTLAENCQSVHSTSEYGENIWEGTAGAFSIASVVDSWASEKADYNYETNSCASDKVCGHYTQVVWADSKRVGCGTISCDGKDIWVCQYDPPGNFIGEKPY